MNPVRTALLAAILASIAAGQGAAAKGQEPASPALQKVRTLEQQYGELRTKLQHDFEQLEQLPEQDREAAGDKLYAAFQTAGATIADQVIDMVTTQPDGEVGMAAITAAFGMNVGKAQRAVLVEALSDHHATGEAIIALLPRLRYVGGKSIDALLQKVLDDNPSPAAKGSACLVMAQRATGESEREQLLEQCVARFADVKSGGEKIGDLANRQLTALRNIKVGKVPPDIAGHDMDGVAFKLSDYRGKVVVLDFWGFW